MRAVNLIPPDSKRGGLPRAKASTPRGPAVAVIGLLVVALVFVTIYVLTTNSINDRRAQIATVQSETVVLQAQAKRLTDYASFVKLAADREATVRQIATQRFDWHTALSDLSKVVPANTSLQSLLGTVAPNVTVAGAGGGGGSAISTGSLRGAIPAPAFEMRGCTSTQDDVARLMSRLRLINGVTRVTLADSVKQDTGVAGAAVAAGSSSNGGSCGANTPSFDLVVFFKPLPGAVSSTTAAGAPAATSTTTTATTSTSTTQASTTPSSTSQPVNSTSGGSK